MSTPYEWRIDSIEQSAHRAERRLHELDSLRSDVDSLERALRESRSEVDALRDELRTTNSLLDTLREEVRNFPLPD